VIKATLIADSITHGGRRLSTFECVYPFYIHAEVMTHRQFSRNAQSARAIPIEKYIQGIIDNPVEPIFMKNKAGMAAEERLIGYALKNALDEWNYARDAAIVAASNMVSAGVHKQIANRILQPYSHTTAIISSTEWDNFFQLRIHPAAQQEIQELAVKMRDALYSSKPIRLLEGEYHLPYIQEDEKERASLLDLKKISVARCARVSYLNHDKQLDYKKDIELFDRLFKERHMSPFEHIATPSTHIFDNMRYISNFRGWVQLRKIIENNYE